MSSTQKTARLVPQVPGQQSEEVVHISSFALVKRGNNELLLVKRIRPEFSAGKWLFPSAIVNFGEHPEAAIKRILREQVGAEAKNVRLVDFQSWGDKHWDICLVYEVSIDGPGKLHADIEKAEYFDRSKLPAETRSDHLEVLEALGSKG
jgi:ADP-ribose pyrophosphatase YjhB (NUDIX family)